MRRFTLTMWDVKRDSICSFSFCSIWFYLNYVGCKVLIFFSLLTYKFCFTLTMWDVKVFASSSNWNCLFSFTLTMWDVKFVHLVIYFFGLLFYLNYVGCKVTSTAYNDEFNPKFYLNYVGCKVFQFVFYLFQSLLFYLNYVGCKDYPHRRTFY